MIDYFKQQDKVQLIESVIELRQELKYYKSLVENLKQQLYFLNNKRNGQNN